MFAWTFALGIKLPKPSKICTLNSHYKKINADSVIHNKYNGKNTYLVLKLNCTPCINRDIKCKSTYFKLNKISFAEKLMRYFEGYEKFTRMAKEHHASWDK